MPTSYAISRIKIKAVAAMLIGAFAGPVALAATPPLSTSVEQYFYTTYPNFEANYGKTNTRNITLANPVGVPDAMNRGVAGQQWTASADGYTFKITIENGAAYGITDVVNQVKRLPTPYLRALQEVSGPVGEDGVNPEDGLAVYKYLDGAWGHGSKYYINLDQEVIQFGSVTSIAHEAGHALQQVYSETHSEFMANWEAAIVADGRSVSGYGNGAPWEDLAEFAAYYSVALEHDLAFPNGMMRAELKAMSPQRYALWEPVLGVQVPEPASLTTVAIAGMLLGRRQRSFGLLSDPDAAD